jgi:hypothetical protein
MEYKQIKVVVVVLLLLVLSFHDFVPTSAHPSFFLNKLFVQIYLNVSLKLFGLRSTNQELELLTIPNDLHAIA